jgi:hypothetical protein
MDAEQIKRALRALDAALAVFRDAKGRLRAADVRVFSMISAARSATALRLHGAGQPGTNSTALPFILDGAPTQPLRRIDRPSS